MRPRVGLRSFAQEMGKTSRLFCSGFVFKRHQRETAIPGFYWGIWESCANSFAVRSRECSEPSGLDERGDVVHGHGPRH